MNFFFQVGSFKSSTNANPTEQIVSTASLQDISQVLKLNHIQYGAKKKEPNTNTVVVLVRL